MKHTKRDYFIPLIVALVMLFSPLAEAQENQMINFNHDAKSLNDILKEVKEKSKTGMLFFTATWCFPCEKLQKEVFTNEEIKKYVEEHFSPFWLDVGTETGENLRNYYNVHAYPTIVIIKNDGEIIDKIIGYSPPEEYKKRLENSLSGDNTILSLREKYEADPTNNELALTYGIDLVKKRDYESAKPVLEELVGKFNDNYYKATVYFELGNIYRLEQNSDKAIYYYERGLQEEVFTENKNLVISHLGKLLFEKGDYANTIRYLEMIPDELLSGNWKTYEIKRNLVYLPLSYYLLGDKTSGKRYLDKISQILCENINEEFGKEDSNNNTLIMQSFGRMCIYHEVGTEDILPWLKEATEVPNLHIRFVYFTYGLLLGKKKRYNEAIEAIEMIFEDWESDKHQPEKGIRRQKLGAKAQIAALLIASGETNEGKEIIDKLFNENTDKETVYYFLADAFNEYNIGLNDAVKWIEQAIETSGNNDSRYLFIRGELLYKIGDINKGLELMNQALDFSPNYMFKCKLERYQKALKQK